MTGRLEVKRNLSIPIADALAAEGAVAFAKACELGLEGVVSKLEGSFYKSGKSRNWLRPRTLISSGRDPMPRDAIPLADVREPTLTTICELCGRRCGPPFDEGKLGEIGATHVLFPGVNCRKHVTSAARLITEPRACTPGRRVIDPCSMDVQPCSSHRDARICLLPR
jgi:hypothetical protein